LISRSWITTFIAALSKAAAAFRIDNLEAGEVFFTVNSFIISLPRFSEVITIVVSSDIISLFSVTTHLDLSGFTILLRYNLVAFYLDRIFSSLKLILRASA